MSKSDVASLPHGVVVEFDFAVLNGHRVLRDVCAVRLKREGIKFDDNLACRVLTKKTLRTTLEQLFEQHEKSVDVDGVIADITSEFSAKLKGSLKDVPAGFKEFVKAVLGRNLKVVIVTNLNQELVEQVFTDIATDKLAVVSEAKLSSGAFSWERWRRASRKCGLFERLSVAVAGSGYSVKGALIAGMGIMSKSSPEVEYQDFGGSDVWIEEYSGELLDDVLRLLHITE